MEKDHFLSQDEKEIVGKRIRELRIKAGMTQSDIAEAFANYLGREKKFRYSTICGWEKGNIPRQKTLYDLADFLGISPSYFMLDKSSLGQNITEERMIKIKKVSEQLKMYDGLPVWCSFIDQNEIGSLCGKWGIVDMYEKKIVFSSTSVVRFDDINFQIYRQPIQFSYSIEATSEPLSLSVLMKRKKIWVEPLNGSYETRQLAKGYGTVNKALNLIVMDNGIHYSIKNYGVSFLAFDDPCDYEPEIPLID